jgi:homoserine O-acetyltransferase
LTSAAIVSHFPGLKCGPYLQTARVATENSPLILESGAKLPEVVVAYETYGRLSEACDNVILIVHALTGDSHPAAHDQEDEVGWWEPLVGPGRPIDTDVFFVVCSNVLGGCQGTTGPASPDPATGRPYGMSFPQITIRDMVHVQKRLLDTLGIEHLVMVIGGSMGGAQALEWAVSYPDSMDGVVIIAAPGYATAQAIAYNKVGRDAVMLDPGWQGGDYYGTPGPVRGLAIARVLGMITYQSESSMADKFGRRIRAGNFEVENYLDYQGESLIKRFDANSYLYLIKALDLHDVGVGHSSYQGALARIRARVLVVGVSSDILYPSYQQQELVGAMCSVGVRAEYREIESIHGHDGFLIDFPVLRPMVDRFISEITPVSGLWRPHALFKPSELAYLGARLITDI